MRDYTKSEAKDWAREKFRGLENVLMPSLMEEKFPGGGSTWNLDEAGIRHDVRECKKHGFFMTGAAVEGLPFLMMEYLVREFWEVALDEAGDDILIDAYISQNTFDDTVAAAKLADEMGFDVVMLAYPPFQNFKSEEEVVEFTRAVCDQVDLAVTIFATHKYNLEKFHPSTFSPHIIGRLADIENVVAVKLGVINVAHSSECFKRFGDKVLLNAPYPEYWNTYVPEYGQQWAGNGPYEVLQDHDHLYMVDYMNLLIAGEYDKAMEIYWKVFPAYEPLIRDYLDYTVYEGNYNFMHWKYYSWLAGFNGGPLPLPLAKIYEHQKEKMRAARARIGLENPTDEDEFYVGRSQYVSGREKVGQMA